MQETDKKRILVVDDHSIVRHGLAMLLQAEPDFTICAEATDYDEALAAVHEHTPDILVVDISLKGKNGLELIRALRADGYKAPVLVLSMHDESVYAQRALKAGAQGYVMKENADENIVDAVRAIAAGEVYVSEDVKQSMLQQVAAPEETNVEDGIAQLTDREKEIFELIGKGWPTRQIADALKVSVRTVEVHRAHIKKKLGCAEAAQVVREAVKFVEMEY